MSPVPYTVFDIILGLYKKKKIHIIRFLKVTSKTCNIEPTA